MTTRRVTATEVIDNGATRKEVVKKAVPYVMSYEFIYWILGIVEGLLAMRFFFRLAGANPGAGFTRFVYGITNVFMAPFRFIFPTSVAEGAVFEWSILVAMFVYLLLVWTLIKLISILYTAEQVD